MKSKGILSLEILYTIYAQNKPLENKNNHKILCTQKFLYIKWNCKCVHQCLYKFVFIRIKLPIKPHVTRKMLCYLIAITLPNFFYGYIALLFIQFTITAQLILFKTCQFEQYHARQILLACTKVYFLKMEEINKNFSAEN